MMTGELIAALSADAQGAARRAPAREWTLAIVGGFLFAFLAMALTLHVRSDFVQTMGDPRVLFKYLATVSMVVPAAGLAFAMTRPQMRPGRLLFALAAPVAMFCLAGALEMRAMPATLWWTRALGLNALACAIAIPLLGLAPFAAILFVLSRGATTAPRLAGRLAGFAGGAIGAAAYAAHCTDDSPFFVAIWYSLGVFIVGALGAFLGPRVLRW